MKILRRADGDKIDTTGSRNGNSIWNRLIDNASAIIGSIGGSVTSAIAAKTGNYPEQPEVDNTPTILAISAVAAIVLIVILLIIFKK